MQCETKNIDQPAPANSLYKRPLADGQIAFSSAQGRKVFQEAMAAGTMNGYFPLAEQFHTQAEPTYCGISSLVMVLNALQIDPKRLWKGVWHWFSEDIADCCQQLAAIDKEGISLDRLAEMARCNGLHALAVRASAHAQSLDAFRHQVMQTCRAAGDAGTPGEAMIVSYSRAALGQTGDGHFSPVGGFHPEQDLVLLLDVARFKYPPHWVTLPDLWKAMQTVDSDTGLLRGYLHLKPAVA